MLEEQKVIEKENAAEGAPHFTSGDLLRISWSTGEMTRNEFFQVDENTPDLFQVQKKAEKSKKTNKTHNI